jgi:hypothetical protein
MWYPGFNVLRSSGSTCGRRYAAVEIARKKVGISIVLVATFYTMLMLVSHGGGLYSCSIPLRPIARKRLGSSTLEPIKLKNWFPIPSLCFFKCVMQLVPLLVPLRHGVSLQFNQRQTADFVLENFSNRPSCPTHLIPKLCAFGGAVQVG